MPSDRPGNRQRQLIISTDAIPEGETRDYDTFDEAVAALRAQLEPGASIDLHDETCALANDGCECTCVPVTLKPGASA